MPSVSPVLHTQDTSQTRDCRIYTNYVHWQIILMYHWTTWWEETGNRKKSTKGGTLQSNHSRNVYQLGVNPPADIASGRIAEVRSRSMSCNCMTRTSQQECRGILEKVSGGNRIKAEKKTLSEEGVFFYVSKEKTFTGYVLLRENTVCGIIMEV